jgi:hypothetical protein
VAYRAAQVEAPSRLLEGRRPAKDEEGRSKHNAGDAHTTMYRRAGGHDRLRDGRRRALIERHSSAEQTRPILDQVVDRVKQGRVAMSGARFVLGAPIVIGEESDPEALIVLWRRSGNSVPYLEMGDVRCDAR